MAKRVEAGNETTARPQPTKVDLNRADETTLRTLPGIGRKLAGQIIAYRETHGPFLFTEDITEVSGVTPALYEELADRMTVTIPTAAELGEAEAVAAGITPGEAEEDMAPPPVPEKTAEDEPEAAPLAIEAPPPIPVLEPAAAEGAEAAEPEWVMPEDVAAALEEPEAPPPDDSAIPMPGPLAEDAETAQPEKAPRERGRFAWFWGAMLGAVLGGCLGLGLSMLVFAAINGSVDVSRSVAMRRVNGQLDGISVELDAARGDIGTLQGDVSGLRERVEVLSGLTARMEQAEETLATFTKEIQALESETEALTTSLMALEQNVETMSETLDAVEAQTEKATTFFEGLQQLLQEVFEEAPAEPESAAPELEVVA